MFCPYNAQRCPYQVQYQVPLAPCAYSYPNCDRNESTSFGNNLFLMIIGAIVLTMINIHLSQPSNYTPNDSQPEPEAIERIK